MTPRQTKEGLPPKRQRAAAPRSQLTIGGNTTRRWVKEAAVYPRSVGTLGACEPECEAMLQSVGRGGQVERDGMHGVRLGMRHKA
eukprot:9498636-Pyramimonas_sp.AAC.1